MSKRAKVDQEQMARALCGLGDGQMYAEPSG